MNNYFFIFIISCKPERGIGRFAEPQICNITPKCCKTRAKMVKYFL